MAKQNTRECILKTWSLQGIQEKKHMSKITLAALGKHCTFLAFVLSQTTAHPQRKRRGRSMAYFMWIQSKHMILSLNCLLKTSPQVIKMQHPFLCCESTAAPKNSPGQPALPRRTANITAFILAKTICSMIHRWHFLWFPSHMVWVYSKIMLGFTPEPPSQPYSSRKVPNRKRKYLISFVTKLPVTELSCIGITFFPHWYCFWNLVLWVCPSTVSSALCKDHSYLKKLPHRWKKVAYSGFYT